MPTESLSAHTTPAFSTACPETRSLGEAVSAAGDTKIELLARSEAEGVRLELVEHSWGSGLGWYPRKRLTLDAEQGQRLAALLAAQFAPSSAPEPPPAPKLRRPRPCVEQEGNVIRLLFPSP